MAIGISYRSLRDAQSCGSASQCPRRRGSARSCDRELLVVGIIMSRFFGFCFGQILEFWDGGIRINDK